MGFSNDLKQRISGPIAKDMKPGIYEGIVTQADPDNNRCTVIVGNMNGQEIEDVPVMLYDNGTGWFPKASAKNPDTTTKEKKNIESKVSVQIDSNGAIIIGRAKGIPYPEIRAAQELKNDMHPDSGGCPPGAEID